MSKLIWKRQIQAHFRVQYYVWLKSFFYSAHVSQNAFLIEIVAATRSVVRNRTVLTCDVLRFAHAFIRGFGRVVFPRPTAAHSNSSLVTRGVTIDYRCDD